MYKLHLEMNKVQKILLIMSLNCCCFDQLTLSVTTNPIFFNNPAKLHQVKTAGVNKLTRQ